MMGYSVETSRSRVAVGEYDEIWTPRNPRQGRVGVVLAHGSGSPAQYIDPGAQRSSMILAAELARVGIPCVAGDFGQQTWGNDTAVARIESAWSALRAVNPTMRSDKVLLLGVSMGGCNVARYAEANPTKVAGVVGIIPLWDLVSFYTANVGATQGEIAGAWGVSPGAALPTRADVLGNVNAAKGIPHLCGYSTADQTVLPPWTLNYAAAVGATTVVTDSTYGHSDQAVAGMPVQTVGRFLVANGA